MAEANGPKEMVDLRSDTVTKPTAAMRGAVAALTPDAFGDDVYGVQSLHMIVQAEPRPIEWLAVR